MSYQEIENEAEEKIIGKPTIIRNATDLQRLKLEKLMKHPDKPILLPEKPKDRGVPVVPEFVRNVMGSSAGAGSGEFHVYRHLRRKEYARQKYMREKGERDRLDDEYHKKLEDNKKKAADRTAKKRAKRQKRRNKKGSVTATIKNESDSEESSEIENEEEQNIKQGESEQNDSQNDSVNDLQNENERRDRNLNETSNKNDPDNGKEVHSQNSDSAKVSEENVEHNEN
ncbi:hypothetical protein RI129_009505 [Pyrocoelia pectoralis]|uniref:PRKR-interacting protein 1 n=1 Tax=Pyrocoelia pectoralis TaxID=417401 RepID=A0AAN7ZJ09_9COLE